MGYDMHETTPRPKKIFLRQATKLPWYVRAGFVVPFVVGFFSGGIFMGLILTLAERP